MAAVDIVARKRGDMEMERLKELLDKNGIDWEQSGTMSLVTFDGPNGQCIAFPSQTYDGKMCLSYTTKAWCDTAEEALRLCGVLDG